MENEDESCFQNTTAASGKHYEWQLFIRNQWLRIDNDEVIEAHYCQPGAKGITINTKQGQVFIDFDTLQTDDASLRVQRLSFPLQGQTEDISWFFRGDHVWREYGSQISGMSTSSVSSKDVELHFSLNALGVLHFTVGSTGYSLDFSTMTQQNLVTGLSRNVRRRPKFISTSAGLHSTSVLNASSPPQSSDCSFKWEVLGNEGQWLEYQAQVCSFDSTDVERQYQLNPQGQQHFRINRFTYTLDFSRMCQINNEIGTTRAVRRTRIYGNQKDTSSGPQWQFQDIDRRWKTYSKGNGLCSVSSADIELQYQQNPSGTVTFTTKRFSYELDFSAMTQRNRSTNTTRPVRRLAQ